MGWQECPTSEVGVKFVSCVCMFVSDLNSNRLQRIQGLTFEGLLNVVSLRLRRNSLSELMDGAFYGLTSIQNMYVTPVAIYTLYTNSVWYYLTNLQ